MSDPARRTVDLFIDGVEFTVPLRRTVAAALQLDVGESGWRTTRRESAARGLFCGIGACYDCLATVDGRRGVRTCLVEVADGMDVRTGADDE